MSVGLPEALEPVGLRVFSYTASSSLEFHNKATKGDSYARWRYLDLVIRGPLHQDESKNLN